MRVACHASLLADFSGNTDKKKRCSLRRKHRPRFFSLQVCWWERDQAGKPRRRPREQATAATRTHLVPAELDMMHTLPSNTSMQRRRPSSTRGCAESSYGAVKVLSWRIRQGCVANERLRRRQVGERALGQKG